jgi:tetratricopeptide (TPR) repeat protein
MILASVRSRGWMVDCLRELGQFAEGRACGTEAVRIAEAAGHLGSTVFAQDRLGRLTLYQGDLQHAIPTLEHTLARCRAADIPLYLDMLTTNLGLAYAWSGRVVEALSLLTQVVLHEDTGRGGGNAAMTRVGEVYLLAGHLADALPLAERALALARDRQERGNQAWALRLLGEIAMRSDTPETVLTGTYYRQALTLAEALGMQPLVAHCHLGLGKLYARIGHHAESRAELSAAVELYRGMAMMLWLPQAEALLAAVAP